MSHLLVIGPSACMARQRLLSLPDGEPGAACLTLLLEEYSSKDGSVSTSSDGTELKQQVLPIYLLGLLVCSCAPRWSRLSQCIISRWAVSQLKASHSFKAMCESAALWYSGKYCMAMYCACVAQ